MYGVFDPPVLPDGFRKQCDILFQTGNKKPPLDGGFTPDRSLGFDQADQRQIFPRCRRWKLGNFIGDPVTANLEASVAIGCVST